MTPIQSELTTGKKGSKFFLVMDRERELAKIKDFLTIDDKTKEKLLKIDEFRFFKLLSPLILLGYLQREFSKINDPIILPTFYIATIEALQSVKQGKVYKGKYKLISSFLRSNLSKEDKINLLKSFTFSEKYKFQKDDVATYHLMREDYISSITNSYETPDMYCLTGSRPECQCVKWLRENESRIDFFTEKLSFQFYQMRNAVFHDVSAVLWLHDFENSENSSGTLADAYPTSDNDGSFMSYNSGLNKNEFYQLLSNSFKKFLYEF